MPHDLTTERVWAEIEKRIFGVLGTVSRKGRPLTSGIVYKVKDRRLLISTGRSTQKARNIEAHPRVSVTVTVERRIPFLPWIKIPPATITFSGEARFLPPSEVDRKIQDRLIGTLFPEPRGPGGCVLHRGEAPGALRDLRDRGFAPHHAQTRGGHGAGSGLSISPRKMPFPFR